MDVQFTIIDPDTKKETIFNINDVAYIDEGKNLEGEECVWVKMRNNETHSFKVDYKTFNEWIDAALHQAGWNGLLTEMEQPQNE